MTISIVVLFMEVSNRNHELLSSIYTYHWWTWTKTIFFAINEHHYQLVTISMCRIVFHLVACIGNVHSDQGLRTQMSGDEKPHTTPMAQLLCQWAELLDSDMVRLFPLQTHAKWISNRYVEAQLVFLPSDQFVHRITWAPRAFSRKKLYINAQINVSWKPTGLQQFP